MLISPVGVGWLWFFGISVNHEIHQRHESNKGAFGSWFSFVLFVPFVIVRGRQESVSKGEDYHALDRMPIVVTLAHVPPHRNLPWVRNGANEPMANHGLGVESREHNSDR